jgi:Na+-driven multidrug efflux pump
VFGKIGFPECGLLGRALATIIAQSLSFIILFGVFFSQKNRNNFHTGAWSFSLKACWRYSCVGIPTAINSFLNGASWSWAIQMVANRISFSEFSAFGLILSLCRIMASLGEGLGKGNCVLISNFLGERRNHMAISSILSSSLRLWLILYAILLPCVWIFSQKFVAFFMGTGKWEVFSIFHHILPWASLLMLLEGIWFQLHFSLVAFKDTSFLMITNISSHFAFLIIPAYYLINGSNPHAVFILQLNVLHQFVRSCVLRWRYKTQIPKAIASEDS